MTDSQAPELLPCPFCGGKAHVFKNYDPDTDGKFYSYKCSSCGAQSPERYAVETCGIFFAGLRDLWNRRDHANALIGAAYEDAADTCADSTWRHEGEDAYSRGLDRGALEQASTCAAEVRSRIPSDAQAALDRIREEGRIAGLREAAGWHQQIAQHDQSGLDYSSAVGIPISNAGELSASVETHEWCAREILALIDQKDQPHD